MSGDGWQFQSDLMKLKMVGLGAGLVTGLSLLATTDSAILYFAFFFFAVGCALYLSNYFYHVWVTYGSSFAPKKDDSYQANILAAMAAVICLVVSALLMMTHGVYLAWSGWELATCFTSE